MSSGEINLIIEQFASWSLDLTVTDAAGAPYDLTGAGARMQIRAATGGDLFVELSTAGGEITIPAPATDGKIELRLTPAETGALAFGSGLFDLLIDEVGGDVLRIIQGRAKLSAGVTT